MEIIFLTTVPNNVFFSKNTFIVSKLFKTIPKVLSDKLNLISSHDNISVILNFLFN